MDATVTINFNGAATDVTTYVRNLSIRRGRSRELDQFTSGQCSFTLDNRDRRFDPLNTTGPYYGKIRPRLQVTVVSDGINLFSGFIEDWNYDYNRSGDSVADVVCIDGLALLSQTNLAAFTNVEESPSERIVNVVSRPEVSYGGSLNLDAGLSILQPDTVSEDTNTLNYLQKVADTDFARLFVDGSGALRYRDRTSGLLSPPRVVFADTNDAYIRALIVLDETVWWIDATEPLGVPAHDNAVARTILQDATWWIDSDPPSYVPPVLPFTEVGIEFGSEFLFNRVSATRENGGTVDAENLASQDVYGIRTLSRSGLLFTSDLDTEQYAIYLADLYGVPDVRITGHQVIMEALTPVNQRYMKRLEIGDVVRTVWRPNNTGDVIDRYSIIEGVEHVLIPSMHMMRVQLTPFARTGFVLGSAEFGLLDTSEVTY